MKPIHMLAALLLTATACGTDRPSDGDTTTAATAETSASERAILAARVANAIAQTPGSADSILSAAGYTAQSFERLMYDIASDSAEAAAYAAARNP